MPTEVKLPNLGDGVDTGDVLELLVKEGDTVAKDQGILEIETGKATMQVPSPAAGKVKKVHVRAGQTIAPGALLLTVEEPAGARPQETRSKGQETGDRQQQPAKAPEPKPAPSATAPPKQESAPAPATPKAAPAAAPAPQQRSATPAPPASAPPAPPEPTHNGGGVAAGPAVRRFAREVGVDLSRVSGSGSGGRGLRLFGQYTCDHGWYDPQWASDDRISAIAEEEK